MSRPASVNAAIESSAKLFDLTPEDILSRSHTARVVNARWHAMAVVRATVKIAGKPPSYSQIGHWFDRDHTAVLYAFRRVKTERAEPSPRFTG